MAVSQQEEASWDDIDWGILGPNTGESAPEVSPTEKESPPPTAPDSPAKSAQADSLATAGVPQTALKDGPTSAGEEVLAPAEHRPESENSTESAAEHPVVFSPAGSARLVLKSEGNPEVTVPIRDTLTVGRNADNGLVIRDLYVSGYHARLIRRSEGSFEIEDLNSTGGTFINEHLVQRRFLKSGDVLRFATVEAVFHYTAGSQLEANASMGATLPPAAKAGQKVTFDPNRLKRSVLVLPDGTRFFLPATGEVTVGRLPTNEVMISDPRVSGNHARILCSGGRHFEVFDLNSTWGTFVNRTKVSNHVLADGDVLTIGVVDCLLEL